MKPSPACVAAHQYAMRGWAVFPVDPGGKRPLGRLVPHGLKQATTDHDVIERWWHAQPQANIGLLTGQAFDVLDVDGDEGYCSLQNAVQHGAPSLEGSSVVLIDNQPTIVLDGPTIHTGGGGFHLYVESTGVGNKTSFIPHCDWRGRGGYVVAPPSLHESGRRYEWWPGEQDPWSGPAAPLQPVPPWLLDRLEPPRPTPCPVQLRRPVGNAYARRALESEVENVTSAPEGQRNHTLNRASFAVGQLAWEGLLDIDDAVDGLLAAAARCGLGARESRNTIASGLNGGRLHPRGLST